MGTGTTGKGSFPAAAGGLAAFNVGLKALAARCPAAMGG